MTTWEYAENTIRHPWFASSLKRKHTESSEEDDETFTTFRSHDVATCGSSTTVHSGGQSGYTVEEFQDVYPTPPNTGTTDRPFSKRRRCDTIERKMARMQLDQDVHARNRSFPSAIHGTATWQGTGLPDVLSLAPGMASATSTSSVYSTCSNYSNANSLEPSALDDFNPAHIYRPSIVEEPTSPDSTTQGHLPTTFTVSMGGSTPLIEDIRMKGDGPASYERERDKIVITDLDEAIAEAEEEERLAKAANPSTSSFSDEDYYKPEVDPHPYAGEYADSNADFSISEMLLEHIKRQTNIPYKDTTDLLKMRDEANAGALVLFKPSPLAPSCGVGALGNVRKITGVEDAVLVDPTKLWPCDDTTEFHRDNELKSSDNHSIQGNNASTSASSEEDAMEVEL